MTLRRPLFRLSSVASTGLLLSCVTAAAIGLSLASPETVVTERFASALEQTPSRTVAAAGSPLVSGSEAYWLDSKRHHPAGDAAFEPAAWAPLVSGVSIGDRLTISSGKSERILEIVAIAKVENAPAAPSATGHVAVTCRDLSTPDHRLTTFVVPEGTAFALPRTARAL